MPSIPSDLAPELPPKDGFSEAVASQLQALQAMLMAEHEKHIWPLQAEISRFRAELICHESARAEEASTYKDGEVGAISLGSTAVNLDELGDDVTGEHRAWADVADELQGRFVVHNMNSTAENRKDVVEVADASHEDNELGNVRSKDVQQSLSTKEHLADLARERDVHERTFGLYGEGWLTKAHTGTKTHYGEHLAAPREKWSCVQRLVFSSGFELTSGAVIMANTVVMACQQQYDGFDHGFALQQGGITEPANKTWPEATWAFRVCHIFFNLIFVLELLLRIAANRWRSVRSGWIWFDAVVVTVGFVDLLAQDALAFNPGMMRAVRLIRLVRLLKVFQAMSSFDSLFLLLKAVHASRQALVWSFLILGLVQLIVGLFLCQVLQDFLADGEVALEARQRVFGFFGTFSRTTLTMFQITMANWIPPCRALADNVSELFVAFFIVYRCMFLFAILKVIAAVFITETNRVLESDDELTILKHDRAEYAFKKKLFNMFKALDSAGSGKFGWRQLEKIMQDDSLAHQVTTLGFERHDFEKLFWLLDNGSGEISIYEFVNKMVKLKGSSKSIDLHSMLKLAHRMDQKIELVLQCNGITEPRNSLECVEEDLACRI